MSQLLIAEFSQGNKKGPVGRWDFDTPEEYADYMSRKEALPKAAFQYGVKMAEGEWF
jgi:IK cytokine